MITNENTIRLIYDEAFGTNCNGAITYNVFKHNSDLQKSAMAFLAEKGIRDWTNGNIRHEPGYDVIGADNKKYEVKSTGKSNQKVLTIENLTAKLGLCDYIAILDFENYRAFVIPHDDFFNEGNTKILDAGRGRLKWCFSYNDTGKRQVLNTQFILKYEQDFNEILGIH